jgi:thiamine-monophosphate kinase
VSARRFDERSFHAWLHSRLPAGRSGLLPLGDDTAAIPLGRDRVLLLTTDALSEGTHFLDRSPPKAIGAATAAASLSDAAAKGGRPIALLLDLLLPPETPRRWAEQVVAGAEAMGARFGAHVVGGDTKPSRSRAVVGTVVASGDRKCLAPRSAARPGDLLVTTGRVGRGGVAALPLLGRRRPTVPELRQMLTIHPRVAEGGVLGWYAHAMLDTSDGIAEGARLLSAASRVKVTLEWEKLPLVPKLTRPGMTNRRREELAFFGGDYELFAALPADRLGAARRSFRRLGTPLTVVGEVTRGRGADLRSGGTVRPLAAGGWDPFRHPRPTSSSS